MIETFKSQIGRLRSAWYGLWSAVFFALWRACRERSELDADGAALAEFHDRHEHCMEDSE